MTINSQSLVRSHELTKLREGKRKQTLRRKKLQKSSRKFSPKSTKCDAAKFVGKSDLRRSAKASEQTSLASAESPRH